MGGAQPLAVTLNDGVCLIVDVDRARLRAPGRAPLPRRGRRRPRPGRRARRWPAKAERRAWSIGVVGNCAEVFPELLRRGVPIDIVTDQTSAHDPLSYLPAGIALEDWADYAEKKPEEFTDRARASMAQQVQAMVEFQDAGCRGLRLRQLDPRRGPAGRVRAGVRVPRLRAGLHPAAVLRGQGPVPLGGAVR